MIEIGAVCKTISYQPMIIDTKLKNVPCAIFRVQKHKKFKI